MPLGRYWPLLNALWPLLAVIGCPSVVILAVLSSTRIASYETILNHGSDAPLRFLWIQVTSQPSRRGIFPPLDPQTNPEAKAPLESKTTQNRPGGEQDTLRSPLGAIVLEKPVPVPAMSMQNVPREIPGFQDTSRKSLQRNSAVEDNTPRLPLALDPKSWTLDPGS